MKKKKWSPSWIAIIICLFVFWPASILLIWKKLSTDRAAAMKNSKILRIIGIVFIILGLLSLGGASDSGTALGILIFYGGGGALIIWGSIKVKKMGEQYKKYIDIVINQNQTTIDNIASMMGLDYEKTVKGLQKMIDLGYFADAYIDQVNHEIVFPSRRVVQTVNPANIPSNNNFAQPQHKAVKCPNCGGNNMIIVGSFCECDFCGSPLE